VCACISVRTDDTRTDPVRTVDTATRIDPVRTVDTATRIEFDRRLSNTPHRHSRQGGRTRSVQFFAGGVEICGRIHVQVPAIEFDPDVPTATVDQPLQRGGEFVLAGVTPIDCPTGLEQ